MNKICLICGALDSCVGNGDAEGCNECYSIEQGFLVVYDWSWDPVNKSYGVNKSNLDLNNNYCVDEDNNIYLQDHELDGPIGTALDGPLRR